MAFTTIPITVNVVTKESLKGFIGLVSRKRVLVPYRFSEVFESYRMTIFVSFYTVGLLSASPTVPRRLRQHTAYRAGAPTP